MNPLMIPSIGLRMNHDMYCRKTHSVAARHNGLYPLLQPTQGMQEMDPICERRIRLLHLTPSLRSSE